jgi:very-short-patch-repair endonuclease
MSQKVVNPTLPQLTIKTILNNFTRAFLPSSRHAGGHGGETQKINLSFLVKKSHFLTTRSIYVPEFFSNTGYDYRTETIKMTENSQITSKFVLITGTKILCLDQP